MTTSRLKRLHQFLIPPCTGQGGLPYLWLVYLLFFFIEWPFRPVGPVELVLSLLTVALFLALYFSAFRRKGRGAFWHVAGMVALAVAWSGSNAGASVFFIYGASFAYLVGPPRISLLVVFGIALTALATALLLQPMVFYWIPGVIISIIIGVANVFMGEQERRNAELRLSQAEVRRLARVAERERIARDLHDVLGHTLSVIAVKSELAARLLDKDPDRAGEEMRSVQETARQALAEVREAIGGIRSQDLDEAIDQVRSSLRAADVELNYERDPELVLSPQREAMLALVIREAITNVIRHARASACRIDLGRGSHGETLLEISDNGQGRIQLDGGGVQGMYARIEALGGRLEIQNSQGHLLRATLPEESA
ncbi:sensor histidine kinase [Wenzhouxiangella marina]|nr:sensor histidine kinase [Wenzhouxiangella marina]MBB6086927.1 two-component system sensor histidine kinase DesK [Wenzhouxiangella marina]